MIPPQVNGATEMMVAGKNSVEISFPMIPPQVNGATNSHPTDIRVRM